MSCVVFHPRSELQFASGSRDGSTRLWEAAETEAEPAEGEEPLAA